MEPIREILFYGQYFSAFYRNQTAKVQEKIDYVLFVVTHAERVPVKFFKHLEGIKGLYEIRVEVNNSAFRIFCCLDKGRLVVLFNGFQKKSQKTPKQELEMAIGIMEAYFNEQNEQK